MTCRLKVKSERNFADISTTGQCPLFTLFPASPALVLVHVFLLLPRFPEHHIRSGGQGIRESYPLLQMVSIDPHSRPVVTYSQSCTCARTTLTLEFNATRLHGALLIEFGCTSKFRDESSISWRRVCCSPHFQTFVGYLGVRFHSQKEPLLDVPYPIIMFLAPRYPWKMTFVPPPERSASPTCLAKIPQYADISFLCEGNLAHSFGATNAHCTNVKVGYTPVDGNNLVCTIVID